MIFQNRLKDPKTIVCIGMMFLVIGIVWPMFFHPATKFGQDLLDASRGLLFGLSIGLNLLSAWLAARQRRCGRN